MNMRLIALTSILAPSTALAVANYTNTLDVTEGGVYPTPVALHRPTYTEWRDNPDYNTWTNYTTGGTVYTTPYIIKLVWNTDADALYMTNLCPGVTYTWAATNEDKTVIRSGSFTTIDRAPRWLLAAYSPSVKAPGYVKNFRDLGGWPLLGGGKTKYNVFFRSAKLDNYFMDEDRRANNTLNSEFGIRTELDLRGGNNIVTTNDGNKAVIEDERYYYGTNCYALASVIGVGPEHTFTNSPCCNDGSMRYFRVTMKTTASAVGSDVAEENRKAFHVLGTKAYQPVLFHCVGGRDRTGHIAVMLEALCGVSEENIFRDHLSITFAGEGTMYSERVDRNDLYLLYQEKYNKYGPSLAGHTRAYMESIGVTADEIAGITEAFTGETPDEVIARVDAYEATHHVRTVRFVTDTGSGLVTNAVHRIGDGDMLHPPLIALPEHYESYGLIRTGYTLTGWGEETSLDATNSVIMSTWSKDPEDCHVVWKDPFGSVLGEALVPYGSDATASIPAAPTGTTITGWDTDVTKVTADLVVTCTMTGGAGYLGSSGTEVTSGVYKDRGGDRVYRFVGDTADTYVHIFTNTSTAATFTHDGNAALDVQYLVVGGGGAGGDSSTSASSTSYLGGGGGGGGGGVAGATASLATGETWTIQVGAGGTTPRSYKKVRGRAGASSISNLATSAEIACAPGGTEGGNASSTLYKADATPYSTLIQATCGGQSGRGKPSDMGTGKGSFASFCDGATYPLTAGGLYASCIIQNDSKEGLAGGGSGAGGDGFTALGTCYQAGHGGRGIYSSIAGELRVYGSGGGGGGGFGTSSAYTAWYDWLKTNVTRVATSGFLAGCGANGGGRGATGIGTAMEDAQAGADGFGGGGGGAGSASVNSANGGSGVVILRYTVLKPAITLNTLSATGNAGEVSYTVHGESEEDPATPGRLCVKPGTTAILKAVDAGGRICGCWSDDATGELFYGEEVTVKPTGYTSYTAVFGPAWFYDATAKKISNGDWTFFATNTTKGIYLARPLASSGDGLTLNLTTPITNASGEACSLYFLGQSGVADVFGDTTDKSHRPRLSRLFLPPSLKYIGRSAFLYCTNLTGTVCLPENVYLYRSAFNGCSNLTAVVFKGGVAGGQNFYKDGYQFDGCVRLAGDIVLPDGITRCPTACFRYTAITSIRFPESCVVFGDAVCRYCSALTNVVLSTKTTTFGDDVFRAAPLLKNVTPFLPDTLVTIGEDIFNGSPVAGDLRLKNLKNVSDSAFYGTTNCSPQITSVWMPSVTNVESCAFYSPVLTNVVFGPQQVHFYNSDGTIMGNNTFAMTANPCRYYFPGKAPDLPFVCTIDSCNCTGYAAIFSTIKGGPARLYGSWVVDPVGWKKIMSEVGCDVKDVSYTLPTVGLERVRAIKGVIYYPYTWKQVASRYAWLYDWKSPNEGFVYFLH